MAIFSLLVLVLCSVALSDDRADAIAKERELISSLEEEIRLIEEAEKSDWKNKTRMIKISDRVGFVNDFLSQEELKLFQSADSEQVVLPNAIREGISECLHAPMTTISITGSIGVLPHGEPRLRSDSKKGHLATVYVFLSSFGRIAIPTSKLLRYTKSGKLSKKQQTNLCRKSSIQIDAQEGKAVFVFNHHPDLSLDRNSALVYCDSPDVLTVNVNFFEGPTNQFFETFLATRTNDIPKGYEFSKKGEKKAKPEKTEKGSDTPANDDESCPSEPVLDRITKKQQKAIKKELELIDALEKEIALAGENQRENRTRLTKVLPRVGMVNQIVSEWELSDMEKRLSDDGTVSVGNPIRTRISDGLYVPEACMESVAEAELIEDGVVSIRSDPKQGHLFSVYIFRTNEGRIVFTGANSKDSQTDICSNDDLPSVTSVRGRAVIVYHHHSDLTLERSTSFALCDSPQLFTLHGNLYKGDVNNFYNTFIKSPKKALPSGYQMPGKNKNKQKKSKKNKKKKKQN
eukprot:TRINITY_DN733_c6_g1_i1.p1 TRINITY_DN733_c6_g1~~TRINITY_DN733_c6_g1_i1.p1  ORF type:complete len:516 (+),score=110.03 TRINITY_DN733_c6_g1_i1:92-1639(+)